MTFQWTHEARAEVDILRMSGHVSFNAPDLVITTSTSTVGQGNRPLVLDLRDMAGWGYVGRTAIVNAVSHLAAHRPIGVCAPRDKLTLWALRQGGLGDLIQPDLERAVHASQKMRPVGLPGQQTGPESPQR